MDGFFSLLCSFYGGWGCSYMVAVWSMATEMVVASTLEASQQQRDWCGWLWDNDIVWNHRGIVNNFPGCDIVASHNWSIVIIGTCMVINLVILASSMCTCYRW